MRVNNFLKATMVSASRLGGVTWPLSRLLFRERVDIDQNESLWAKIAPPYTPNPPLGADLDVDIAVIGGGFTGVSACYYLSRAQPGKHIIMLEARSLGNGASGRTAGLMLNWLVDQASYSDDLLRPTYDLTCGGVKEIMEIINRHKLSVSCRCDGTLQIYTDTPRAEAAKRETEKFQGLGIPVSFIDAKSLEQRLALKGTHGAVLDPNSGQLNGLQYVRALRPVLESQGVKIYEDTPVLKLTDGRVIVLETPHATVRAKAVVLATNAYTGKLGVLQDAFFPLHSFAAATVKLSKEEQNGIGWHEWAGFSDDYDRISFSALTPEGHLVFGGGSNAAYQYRFGNGTITSIEDHYAKGAFKAIERTWRNYTPNIAEVPRAAAWSGLIDVTLKRNLVVGRIGTHRYIFYALGFCGHGVVLCNIAGRVIADMYSGDDEKWRVYPFYEARYAPLAPEPFRWIGYQLFTKLTGRSPRV